MTERVFERNYTFIYQNLVGGHVNASKGTVDSIIHNLISHFELEICGLSV